ncbi:MAG TPA: biopolymer transporter ExbD [Nannocystaceae bacterium]|nr:biopolymer transporter ExbD [Nannocystaceae bacterium]
MAGLINSDGGHEEGAPMSSINVTPMVDVMLCLLIIFMVATPMMQPKNADVDIPAGHGKKMTEEEFLYGVISVDGAGNVFLGTLPLSKDAAQMQQEIAANAKLQADGMVFLQGDKNVPFDRIVDVLVALKAAQISSVGFIAKPDDVALKGS